MRMPCPALLPMLLLLLVPAAAGAQTWPGAAPCNTTLQACVDAAVAGATIELDTDVPIDETITLQRSITLRSAAGTRARFDTFRGIFASLAAGAPSMFLRLEDFELINGSVRVAHGGDAALHLDARRLRIRSTSGFGALSATASGTGLLRVRAENNDIDVQGNEFNSPSAIVVSASGGGPAEALIRFNRVQANALGQASAVFVANTSGTLEAEVLGNRIDGAGFNIGIEIRQDGGGSSSAWVMSNVVRGQVGEAGRPGAITAYANAGTLAVQVINNSVVANAEGISISGRADLGAVVSGTVANNLVAGNAHTGISIDPEHAPAVSNRHNLLHDNGFNEFTPGPGTIQAGPLLRVDGFRVLDGSPAVNAGDTALVLALQADRDFPLVDVDGLRRVKDAAVDIGAFEAGTLHHLHIDREESIVNNVSPLQWSTIAGDPGATVLATANWNPRGVGGVYNNAHTGVYYFGGIWRLFNEGIEDMPQGAAFNVLRADADGSFGHLTDAGNQSGFTTALDDALINSQPDKVLQVEHHWNGHGSGGVYMDAAYGVGFFGPNWLLLNLDSAAVPLGAAFTVYAQDPSQSAYVHTVRSGEISGNYSILSHPLLDGRPCAQIQVTAGVPSQPHPLGVYYHLGSQQWALFHQDIAPMVAGSVYHVLFDPAQVEFCSGTDLFRDGFE